MKTKQLTLGIRWQDAASFDNFYVASENAFALSCLQDLTNSPSKNQIGLFIYGSDGSGCSHLLQASCQAVIDRPVAYFPLKNKKLHPEMLQGVESMHLVCIDDIDSIAGDTAWEEAIFHLYNRILLEDTRLVVASHKPVTEIQFTLNDLRSRIQGLLKVEIQTLSDDQKMEALNLRCNCRGFELPLEVARFMISHYQRDMGSLMDALDKLDQETLSEKRRLTIPFVKEVFGL